MNLPSGSILAGQEGQSGDDLFYGPIYRMTASSGAYKPADLLYSPRREGNVLSIGQTRFPGETEDSIVFMDESEFLHIVNPGGQTLWDGNEKYGGSIYYLERPVISDFSEKVDKYYYIPPRILAVDSDDDGVQEILVVSADRSRWTSFLPNVRQLSPGMVYSLTFNQMTLRENWRSPRHLRVSGRLPDQGLQQ